MVGNRGATASPAVVGSPAVGGGPPPDNPPVIESVQVPSTVCVGSRFKLTVVAYDETAITNAAYEYTISYPDGFGERWGGGLTGGPRTWTADVDQPYGGPFSQAGSTITGYVLFQDATHPTPVTRTFPVTINVVNC